MEKRIIRQKSELPDWYNLAKYRKLEKLHCQGWYWQLVARATLWSHFTWMVPDDFFDKYPDNDSAQKARYHQRASMALVEIIREQPILNEDSSYQGRKFIGEILDLPDSGIRHASLADIDRQLFYFQNNSRDMALEYLNRIDKNISSPIASLPLTEMQSERPEDVLLNVQLDAPERLLIENFTAFIRGAKAAQSANGEESIRYRMPDFKQWIRIGILPFLDLKIWEMEESVSIPNRVMADAIFTPDDISGEETVRKTTEKLAYQIIEGNVLKELAVLYATETLQPKN